MMLLLVGVRFPVGFFALMTKSDRKLDYEESGQPDLFCNLGNERDCSSGAEHGHQLHQ